ncbi:MAG: tRNA 5-methoxyuridine(34)/uridine 5-oxyacetic acid(34) synthase CmoB [Gammaproteobacteria bacterium]
MIDWTPAWRAIGATALRPWQEAMSAQVAAVLERAVHGDLPQWLAALGALPEASASSLDLDAARVRIGAAADCDDVTRAQLEALLRRLHPWRKGPYELFGIAIETEWRSDWKWARLEEHIEPLAGRLVLDVGCGNGYHCWRMVGAGAALALGIDPGLRYVVQFQALKRFAPHAAVHVLPLALEQLPAQTGVFDTVFSMGVLYHRRSPLDHLLDLRGCLRRGGQLVLETLVVEGDAERVLVPEGRYARMRNVWFLPSCDALQRWLRRCGYVDVRLVDVTRTTVGEQHSTDWMTFQSLAEFLDPADPTRTIEGLPAPTRAIVVATAP